MGSYLSKPVTDTFPADDHNGKLNYGSSSMQGWRTSQEDAHSCILNFDENASLFAVYDGHGGAEVAQYAASHYPKILKQNASYLNNEFEKALKESFIEFDRSLTSLEVYKELIILAGTDMSSEDPESSKELIEDLKDFILEERVSKIRAQKSIEELSENSNTNPCSSSTSKTNQIDSSMEPCSSSKIKSSYFENNDKENLKNSEVSSSVDNNLDNNEAGCSSSCNDNKINNENNNQEISESDANPSKTLDTDADVSTSSDSNKQDCNKEINNGSFEDDNNLKNEEPTSTCLNKIKRITPNKVFDENKEYISPLYSLMVEDFDDSDDSEDDESESFDLESDEEDEDDEENDSDEYDSDDLDEEDALSSDENEKKTPQKKTKFKPTLNLEEIPGRDSGCTAVVVLIKDNDIYVANAGDSRCVLSRSGKAIEMSIDHKPDSKEEYTRIKLAGGKVTNDGRVNGGLNLSRAFGDHSYKNNKDLSLEDQMITALPDVKKISLSPEDEFIVIACDGIWNSLSNEEVVEFVKTEMKETKKLSEICDKLFFKCLSKDTSGDGTGCDNMTCVIIDLKSNSMDQNTSESVKRKHENDLNGNENENNDCNSYSSKKAKI